MLFASQGTFSLSFAVCTNRTLRDGLIRQLCAEFPAIELLALPADTVYVYRTVYDQTQTRNVSEAPQPPSSSPTSNPTIKSGSGILSNASTPRA
jgi:hypothetical protein